MRRRERGGREQGALCQVRDLVESPECRHLALAHSLPRARAVEGSRPSFMHSTSGTRNELREEPRMLRVRVAVHSGAAHSEPFHIARDSLHTGQRYTRRTRSATRRRKAMQNTNSDMNNNYKRRIGEPCNDAENRKDEAESMEMDASLERVRLAPLQREDRGRQGILVQVDLRHVRRVSESLVRPVRRSVTRLPIMA